MINSSLSFLKSLLREYSIQISANLKKEMLNQNMRKNTANIEKKCQLYSWT